MKTLSAFCLAAAALCCTPPTIAHAQVVISEINFTPQDPSDDQWVELVNLGTSKADISTWSLYLTTGPTTNFWFGFLPGTEIQSAGIMRVHWLVPVKPSTATDVYTGDSVLHFLFGYGGTPIPKSGGGLALLNSQANSRMNDPAIVQDWISWGGNGWKRENLAITNLRWKANEFVTAPIEKDSIALDYTAQSEPTPLSSFFHDASPTPNYENSGGASAVSYGPACSQGSIPTPMLSTSSPAAGGNRDFKFVIQNTVALNHFAILLISAHSGILPFGPCYVLIDEQTYFAGPPVPCTSGTTQYPVQLPSGLGAPVFVQGVVVPAPLSFFDYGFTRGMRVDIGN